MSQAILKNTQSVLKHSVSPHKDSYENYSIIELIAEMDLLGVSPQPLLEIAAHDILNHHGAEGHTYVDMMLNQVIKAQDPGGIFLWTELQKILNTPSFSPHTTIH